MTGRKNAVRKIERKRMALLSSSADASPRMGPTAMPMRTNAMVLMKACWKRVLPARST